VQFLEEIYRNDLVWGQLPTIKAYILNIFEQLSLTNSGLPGIYYEPWTPSDAIILSASSKHVNTLLNNRSVCITRGVVK